MKFKIFLAGSAIAIFAATSVQAADAVIYDEPTPTFIPPSFSWDGGYIGAQAGYGWGKSTIDTEDFAAKLKPRGFLGGVYAGYNFDVGNNVVLGIDGDLTYNNLKETVDFTDPNNNPLFTAESRLRWSGAVRARAGYAFDRFLPYIAGGVAFGNVKHNIYDTAGALSDGSNTRIGWTAGAGIDYAATDNVILRLEYRYTDYGKKDFNTVAFGDHNISFKTNEVRLGLAYKF